MQETKSCEFDAWVGKIPWSRKWQLTLVFFPGKLRGQRSLVGYSPTRATRGYRVTRATGLQEPDTTEHTQTQLPNDCEGVFFYTFGYVNFT